MEGGSANDYDYASGDPVNNFDIQGTMCFVKCGWKKAATKGLRLAAFVPYGVYYAGYRVNKAGAHLGPGALPIRAAGWGAQAVGIAGDAAMDRLKNAVCCRESIYDEHTWGSPNPFHGRDPHPGHRDPGEVWLPGLYKAHGGWSGTRLDWAW